jgi:O-antigen/teichoic acid export membrane protein
MDRKKLFLNFSTALVAQSISFLLSAVMSLLVPKYLGVSAFGFWQLFIFYSTYAGLFHLGLNDGLYLIHGGEPLEKMDKDIIGSQFKIGILFQTAIAVGIIFISHIWVTDGNRQFVLLLSSIFLVILNASGFLGYIFQAANETKIYSNSVIISRVICLLLIALLLILQQNMFELYVIAYVVSQTIALVYCLVQGWSFISSNFIGFHRACKESWKSIRVGSKLLVANFASMLILGVARFVIDGIWGISTFGQFSLALSLENFFILFVSQLAMVLYPALRQSNRDETKKFFSRMSDLLSVLLPLILILYFPLRAVIEWWLPDYSSALGYFALLLPICLFDSRMDLIGATYLKVLRNERLLLMINAVTMVISSCLVWFSAYIVGSIEGIIFSLVLCIIARSLIAERLVASKLGIKVSILSSEELCLTILYMCVIALNVPLPLAFGLIAGSYIIYAIGNKSAILEVLSFRR